jgi:hypothetical protein
MLRLVDLRLGTTLPHGTLQSHAVREGTRLRRDHALVWSSEDRALTPEWGVTALASLHVRDCGGGGDCLFLSIGYALQVSGEMVRGWLAQAVTTDNVDELLRFYAESYREYNGSPMKPGQRLPTVGERWHATALRDLPTVFARRDALRAVMQTQGPTFQGDDTSLKLLMHLQHVAFLVFDAQGRLHPQLFCAGHCRRMVLLRHLPGHWQLLGHVDPDDPYGRLQTVLDPFGPLPVPVRQALLDVYGVQDLVGGFGAWRPFGLGLEPPPPKLPHADASDAVRTAATSKLSGPSGAATTTDPH